MLATSACAGPRRCKSQLQNNFYCLVHFTDPVLLHTNKLLRDSPMVFCLNPCAVSLLIVYLCTVVVMLQKYLLVVHLKHRAMTAGNRLWDKGKDLQRVLEQKKKWPNISAVKRNAMSIFVVICCHYPSPKLQVFHFMFDVMPQSFHVRSSHFLNRFPIHALGICSSICFAFYLRFGNKQMYCFQRFRTITKSSHCVSSIIWRHEFQQCAYTCIKAHAHAHTYTHAHTHSHWWHV